MGESQRNVICTLLGTHFLQDSTLLGGVEGSTATTYTKREKFERKDKNKMAVNFQHNCWETQSQRT